MKRGEYWEKRFEKIETAKERAGREVLAEIEDIFAAANREMESKIRVWYGRFAKNNQITLAEARRWLDAKELAELKWDVKEYIKHGEQAALNPKYIKQLENASARFHISYLEALKIHTQNIAEKVYGNMSDRIDNLMTQQYLDGYYHTMYEVQKGYSTGWDIAAINEDQLDQVLAKPWTADGRTFSAKLWTDQAKLVSAVHTQLAQNIILGRSPDKSIDSIAKVMRTSKSNAGRLIMTESAYFSTLAQRDAFKKLDIEIYEVLATLDNRTSEICQEMDRKAFPMSDFQPGVTAPPFHPFCRTVIIPYFPDDFGERIARDPDTGKTYYVPADISYKEWKEKYVKKKKVA